jgi:hypothetical protein
MTASVRITNQVFQQPVKVLAQFSPYPSLEFFR